MHRLGAAILLAGCATCALADVEESVAWDFFLARHNNGRTVLEALNEASPIRRDGGVFHGYTAWDIRWNFWWQSQPGGRCEIVSVKTRLAIRITLPHLETGDAAAAAVFQPYLRALVAHEEGHQRIARDAAADIDRAIAATPPAASCGELEERANQTARAVLDLAIRREREYDLATDHGCKHGACLVPRRNAGP